MLSVGNFLRSVFLETRQFHFNRVGRPEMFVVFRVQECELRFICDVYFEGTKFEN